MVMGFVVRVTHIAMDYHNKNNCTHVIRAIGNDPGVQATHTASPCDES
jgi:hypothetical protein